MKRIFQMCEKVAKTIIGTGVLGSLLLAPVSHADINGITGNNFDFSASAGHISVADGASVYTWGYSANGSPMQLPGPTLIVTEGETVTVTLHNDLPVAAGNVSIIFQGHEVSVAGGVPGSITREAVTGGTVTYTFTANEPGTYQYHSGSQPDLQVEMGLYGALIVKPDAASVAISGCDANGQLAAYGHSGTCYDREYLYLLSEIDLDVHELAEQQSQGSELIAMPIGDYRTEYWLMNGRTAPDTMASDGNSVLPHQPYGSLTRMYPGEKVLLRVVGSGHEMHPFHTHGNHVRVLARDGNMLVSKTDSSKLAGPLLFTIPSVPGGTVDAIFEWTGKDLGWDMYGHTAGDMIPCIDINGDGYNDIENPGPLNNVGEWCEDHNKPIPVSLPSFNQLAFGGFYSGSPYLGALGALPPGEGGLNPFGGFSFMWHSHTERELVNNDVFPGGMMTMLIVEAPSVDFEAP